jgi:Ca2+-binding RTX toxin-like protein
MEVAAGTGAHFSFVPSEDGTYTVTFTVTDDDTGVGTLSTSVSISIVALQDGDLVVGGTPGDDQIVFTPLGNAGDIQVLLNGESQGVFRPSPSGRLVAYGQAGDDNLQVAGSITLSAWLYGDAGHDRLKGGAGHDVLLGGSGDDLLLGGTGRDLLIGGTGADRLVGNPGEDILIAGFTAFDYIADELLRCEHSEALQAIMDEWTRTDRTSSQRIANLRGDVDGDGLNGEWKLNAATVGNDAEADLLTGAQGDDWFLFDEERDSATDLKDEAFANDLEFILS